MLAVAVNHLIPTGYTAWLLQTSLNTSSQPECMFLPHKRHIMRVKIHYDSQGQHEDVLDIMMFWQPRQEVRRKDKRI